VHRFLVLAALLTAPVTAYAQDSSPLVLRVPASTRALALGGAFPVGTRDSDGIFYNVAFGDALRGFGLHAQRYGRAATLVTATARREWWGGTHAVGPG
jgi:hypothetical protein